MEPHQLVTLFDLLKDLTTVMATLAEETRALRKAHTAVRPQMERIQEAVRATADRPPAQRPPSPVAALRTRYSLPFDAGEFRQAASVYAELLAAEAQGCTPQAPTLSRYTETIENAFRHGRQGRSGMIIHKYARYSIGLYYKRLQPSIKKPLQPDITYLITTCWKGR